ncbi:MAG: HEAT repeat domain-containing protein [Polyangiaceae bacterium]
MGIFDFLRSKGDGKGKSVPPPAAPGGPVDKKLAGPAKVAGDKRAQTYDRIEAIQALVDAKSPAAAPALLRRFTFSIDPSITDQEEKELAFQGIVHAGAESDSARESVVEAVRTFSVRAEQLTWPIKVLRELLDDQRYIDEVCELLEKYDTEYARNVEPKVQLIVALEEVASEDAREAVEPFLEDVNETVRFHAVQTTYAHGNEASVGPLVKLLADEESVRIKNKVAEGLVERGWIIPAEHRDAVQSSLRDTERFGLGRDGKVVAR